MSATILVADRLSHRFGGIQAVNDVSFGLQEGEIVGLIGPNGAGKTTLVNLMTGVHRPQAGRIRFCGVDVTAQRPFEAARRGLARTFQIVQPFPRMSVVENVAAAALFGGARAGVADALGEARAQLDFVGLAAMADRYPRQLSGGQQQRVALARVMALRPRLLLFDEPLSNLDAKLRLQMRDEIRRLQRQSGVRDAPAQQAAMIE